MKIAALLIVVTMTQQRKVFLNLRVDRNIAQVMTKAALKEILTKVDEAIARNVRLMLRVQLKVMTILV